LISTDNLGVVIQGPIISRGRTMKDLTPRNYDSSNNINQIFERIKSTGATPILVTWKNEELLHLSPDVARNTILIEMPDTSRIFSIRNNIKRNNKYKQFYSVLAGVEELSSHNMKYVLKIRTDQDFPVEELISHISELEESSVQERIFTPLLNLDKPNMFYDFYYFSSTITMRKFHQTMLNSKEICSNVHYDTFYRWGMRKTKIRLKNVLHIYPKYPKFTKSQLLLMYDIWKDSFHVFPRKCWRQLVWRGEPFDQTSVKPKFIFSEDLLSERTKEILEMPTIGRMRIELTPVVSFFLTSALEDRIRKIRLLLSRVRNKFRSILNDLINKGK
jgi:hypothetical protein